MRTMLLIVILTVLVLPAGAMTAEPAPGRQAELLYLLRQDCGSCHGMTLKGGLGPALLPAAIADFSDESLVDVILNGKDETPMPPWGFAIRENEAYWLVRRLKEGLPNER